MVTASQRHVIPLQGRPYEEDQVIYDGDDDDDDDGDDEKKIEKLKKSFKKIHLPK